MRNLGERQKRFAEFFVESGNARQSAIRAGFTPNYACKLRKNALIAQYIDERLRGMEAERIASTDAVLKYLTDVMNGKNGEDNKTRMSAAIILERRLQILRGMEGEAIE